MLLRALKSYDISSKLSEKKGSVYSSLASYSSFGFIYGAVLSVS